jgi:hypothetical protein
VTDLGYSIGRGTGSTWSKLMREGRRRFEGFWLNITAYGEKPDWTVERQCTDELSSPVKDRSVEGFQKSSRYMEGSSSIYVPGLTNPRGGAVELCLYFKRLMDRTQKVSQLCVSKGAV